MRFLLLAVIPIGFSNIIGGQMLIPMGEEKKLFQAEVVGAVSNLVINAMLIPAFSSAGAAMATTLSEMLVTGFAMRAALRKVRFHILQPKNLLYSNAGCVVAGLSACGIVQLLPLSLTLKGLVSFAVYVLVFGGTFDIIAKNCPKKLVKSKLHGQFLCAHNNYFSAFLSLYFRCRIFLESSQ